MRILHVSDLHVPDRGRGNRTLRDVWREVERAVKTSNGDRPFDFVVVSGDLSDRAGWDEYERLLEVAENRILPHVRGGERARVVFVPGNHDVDWEVPVGTPLSFEQLCRGDPESIGTIQQRIRQESGAAPYRQVITPQGHLQYLQIVDKDAYASRFGNVQRFLDAFYRDALGEPHRRFSLTGGDAADWSAHVFPEEGVAFFGFNSCWHNDKYWGGARIHGDAIAAAERYLEQLERRDPKRRRFMAIAVWHHGPWADGYAHDRLPIEDIAKLWNARFRVGLHGHVHASNVDTLEQLFGEKFLLSAAGTVGASAGHRPDGVSNQFNIVALSSAQARIHVFSRGRSGKYEETLVRRVVMAPRSTFSSVRDSVRLHQRRYKINADGIAQVDIVLRGCTLKGRAALAVVTPPYGSAVLARKSDSSVGTRTVNEEKLADGRIKFHLDSDFVGEHLSWSYTLSNGYALSLDELFRRDPRHRASDHLPEDWEARPHTVRIASDLLELVTEFEEEIVDPAHVVPVVDRIEEDGVVRRWVPVPEEADRCRVEVKTPSRIVLRVEEPVLGYRYAAAFKPASVGLPIEPGANEFAKALLKKCRQDRVHTPIPGAPTPLDDEAPSIVLDLRRAMEASFASTPGFAGLEAVSWLALLWEHEIRRLLAAFGRFPSAQWVTRFACGSGVAGHAFRFGSVASWVKGRNVSRGSLVYQSRPEYYDRERNHDWVVCVPLLLAPNGPSIGIVSFEGEEPAPSDVAEQLERFAKNAEQGDHAMLAGFKKRLATLVNQAFWSTCAYTDSVEIGPVHKSFAESVLASLGLDRTMN